MNGTPLATEVIKLLKQSIKRIYIILILTIVLFILSIIDSLYQRAKIENILKDLDYIEKTTEVTQDGDSNNYIGNNGDITYGTSN